MNTRHSLKLASVALAFASFGIAAVATASGQQATAGDDAGDSFQSLDANGDGNLTRSEIPSDMTLLRTRLPTYDTNHDGMLDAREYAAAHAALHGSDRSGGGDNESPQDRHDPSSDPTGG